MDIVYLGGTAVHPVLKTPVTMDVSGESTFTVGEEVVLFSKQNGKGQNLIVGMSQGKFAVKEDKKSGRKWVPMAGRKLSKKSPAGVSQTQETLVKQEPLELSEFINTIKSSMTQAK